MTETAATNSAKEVDTTPLYSEDQLAGIKTFEDALALLADAGIEITDISDYGDGFEVMDKRAFVNVPFVLLDYKFVDDGKFGQDFVVLRVVTTDRRKAILTDGSTGLREQVRTKLQAKGVKGGIMCKKGLVLSEYTWVGTENDKNSPDYGKEVRKPAETFYLSM